MSIDGPGQVPRGQEDLIAFFLWTWNWDASELTSQTIDRDSCFAYILFTSQPHSSLWVHSPSNNKYVLDMHQVI